MKRIQLLAIITATLLFCGPVSGKSLTFPKAEKGILDLSHWNFEQDGMVPLEGEWEFYWMRLLTPEDFEKQRTIPPPIFMQLTKVWNGTLVDGKPLGGEGYATYRLQIKVPTNKRYAIKTKDIATAFKMWVLHKTFGNGVVGTTKETMIPQTLPIVAPFETETGIVNLVIQVSNFYHRNGGFSDKISLGTAAQVQWNHDQFLGLDIFIIGALGIMGLYHLGLFFLRRQDPSPLYFGLVCLLLSLRSALTGERLLVQIFTDFSWEWFLTMNYLTFILPTPCFWFYIRHLYPAECSIRLGKWVSALTGLLALIVLFTPPLIFSHTAPPARILIMVSGLYLVYVLILAWMHKREYAVLMWVGMSVLVISTINDILYGYQILLTGHTFSYALFFFVFIQSFILAKRFSNAFVIVETQAEELKRSDETLRQALNQLQKLDQLKDEFLANTSHELRTPLNGIIGLSENLLDGIGGKPTPVQTENLSLIVQSGKRLANLVNDILDLSKIKNDELQLNLQSVDIQNLTNLVLTLSRPLLNKKPVVLRSEISDHLPLVVADENRFQQILLNLVGNAIKFTHLGEIRVRAEEREGSIWISVSDTGIGIPEDKQKIIFFPFEQVDSSQNRIYGGTGLGLNVAKKLVELHGGEILVDSTVGVGSTFSFNLKIADDQRLLPHHHLEIPKAIDENREQVIQESAPIAEISRISNQAFPKQKTILVVDDEPVNVQVLRNHLHLQNYRVLTAGDGYEALEIIDREQPDMIVLDLMMPRMNGYEVTRKIRQTYNPEALPIVMLTAKNQLGDLVEGFECGINDYLTKPFRKQELLSRVDVHLQLHDAIQHLEEKVKERTHQLQKTTEELQRKNLEIIQDLQTAAGLQAHLFREFRPPHFLRIAVYYHPYSHVSGDIYKLYADDSGGFNLFLGDSSGHGVAAALTTIMADILISQKINSSPDKIMAFINDQLMEHLPDDRFMTALLLKIRENGELTVANAGHPPLMILPARGGTPLLFRSDSMILGPFKTPVFQCKEVTCQLHPGDVGILFTDGITERYNASDLYDEERLLLFMEEHSNMDLEALLEKLIEDIEIFAEGQPERDDVTVIVFRFI
ncbi:SpoIIE family protein phosphatase [Deltaproteobacteria bacterium TL4]